MPDLANSPLFAPWKNLVSKVTLYLLTQKVAPVQEAFYFVNDGMSQDGRYLWFYCAFPPSGSAAQGRTLGVVDFQAQEVRHFPETQFNNVSPFIDAATGQAYWGGGDTLWRRGPGAQDAVERVNSLPKELVKERSVSRLATHLTRSADGKEFFVDSEVGLQRVFGTLPVDGGEYQMWQRFERNYNHAQFCPTDPDLVLFAQENHTDPITGLRFGIEDRLWMMRRGEPPRPILPTPTRLTHEWWDADGKHVWCIKSREGLWRVDVESGEVEAIAWSGGSWHAHATHDGMYLVGDYNDRFYRGCPSKVNFLNRKTGREVQLADNPEMFGITGANYHIDPHPRFCCGDQYVVFTTTVRGVVDLAIVPVQELVEKTE